MAPGPQSRVQQGQIKSSKRNAWAAILTAVYWGPRAKGARSKSLQSQHGPGSDTNTESFLQAEVAGAAEGPAEGRTGAGWEIEGTDEQNERDAACWSCRGRQGRWQCWAASRRHRVVEMNLGVGSAWMMARKESKDRNEVDTQNRTAAGAGKGEKRA